MRKRAIPRAAEDAIGDDPVDDSKTHWLQALCLGEKRVGEESDSYSLAQMSRRSP